MSRCLVVVISWLLMRATLVGAVFWFDRMPTPLGDPSLSYSIMGCIVHSRTTFA